MSQDPIPFPEPVIPPAVEPVVHHCHLASIPNECAKQVTRLWAAVMGNGHPEQSMAARLIYVEKKVRQIDKKLWIILGGVGGIAAEVIRHLITKHIK